MKQYEVVKADSTYSYSPYIIILTVTYFSMAKRTRDDECISSQRESARGKHTIGELMLYYCVHPLSSHKETRGARVGSSSTSGEYIASRRRLCETLCNKTNSELRTHTAPPHRAGKSSVVAARRSSLHLRFC